MPKRGVVRLALISVGLLCGAVLAAASAVVLHGIALLAVAWAAALAAGAAVAVTDKGLAAAVDAAWKAAATTVAAIVLVTGLAVLAGGTVAAIACLGSAVVTGVVLLLRARPVRKAWSKLPGRRALWLDRAPVPVAQLPTPALASEWRRTTEALAGPLDMTTHPFLVQRRQEVLDEFERRDPLGFARWLAVAAPPSRDPIDITQDDGSNGTEAFDGQQ